MMRQRHVAGHWHLSPSNQPHIREGVVGGATGDMGEVWETSALIPHQAYSYAKRARKRNCQGILWVVSAVVVTTVTLTGLESLVQYSREVHRPLTPGASLCPY
jgi:hypothetical protein